jgi:hypothetical protein
VPVPDLFKSSSSGALFEPEPEPFLVGVETIPVGVLNLPDRLDVFTPIRLEEVQPVQAAPKQMCKVTYRIGNAAVSNFNITEFQVGSDQFVFPTPIAPGNAEQVEIAAPDRNCEKQKIGLVKGVGIGAGVPIQIESIEVCVLK